MKFNFILILFISIFEFIITSWLTLPPKIVIGVLIRNKAFVLPYFFHYLENLIYPKNRISILIYEDHSNEDNSQLITRTWCDYAHLQYSSIQCIFNNSNAYDDTNSSTIWSEERINNVIKLRQKILEQSQNLWADFLFMIDADIILYNPDTLKLLINISLSENKPVLSPLLNCVNLPYYTNFWGNMTYDGYYIRSVDYLDIKNRTINGSFEVPLLNTAILINLNHQLINKLSFIKNHSLSQNDDWLNFALNAHNNNIKLFINNEHFYGYLPSPVLSENATYQDEIVIFQEILFNHVIYKNNRYPDILKYKFELYFLKNGNKNDVIKQIIDQMFIINLNKRYNRRIIINYMLNEIDLKYEIVEAIDGKLLNDKYLKNNNIHILKGYKDPYFNRSMTKGEIGCFLSHIKIWQKIIDDTIDRAIILEDDAKFYPELKEEINILVETADNYYKEWQFMYLGRKIMSSVKETFVSPNRKLLIPNYSYRTTGYILTYKGALLLLNNKNILQQLIPIDEYLPIMYGKSPYKHWSKQYKGANQLKALASYPAIVRPTHYKGDDDYYSDTE